jgi:hypothetical protein
MCSQGRSRSFGCNRPVVDNGLAEPGERDGSPVHRASRCNGLSRSSKKPHEWGWEWCWVFRGPAVNDGPNTANAETGRERPLKGDVCRQMHNPVKRWASIKGPSGTQIVDKDYGQT